MSATLQKFLDCFLKSISIQEYRVDTEILPSISSDYWPNLISFS